MLLVFCLLSQHVIQIIHRLILIIINEDSGVTLRANVSLTASLMQRVEKIAFALFSSRLIPYLFL